MGKLTTGYIGREWISLDEVDSTNEYLKRVGGALANGAVVIAAYQNSGKGRRGNTWIDKAGDSLAMSVLLKPFSYAKMSCLPLICGMAVRSAVSALTGEHSFIKWPNDVLLGDKKLCGILCESVALGDSGEIAAICGMGVNLCQTADFFKAAGLAHATSVFAFTGLCISAQDMAIAIVNALEPLADRLAREGFVTLAEEYAQDCVNIGRRVRVVYAGREAEADAIGIAPDGALICRAGSRIFLVHSGEASVRGLYGYV